MPSIPTLSLAVLAARSGSDARAILQYQRQKLVPPPRRTAGGLSLYPAECVDRVRLIRRALAFGFRIETIAELLRLKDGRRDSCHIARGIAQRHLEELACKRKDLERMEKVLRPIVESCARSSTSQGCPLLHALSHE